MRRATWCGFGTSLRLRQIGHRTRPPEPRHERVAIGARRVDGQSPTGCLLGRVEPAHIEEADAQILPTHRVPLAELDRLEQVADRCLPVPEPHLSRRNLPIRPHRGSLRPGQMRQELDQLFVRLSLPQQVAAKKLSWMCRIVLCCVKRLGSSRWVGIEAARPTHHQSMDIPARSSPGSMANAFLKHLWAVAALPSAS